jgi:OCT family organic cation transporter-like MFS transporter 4/5
MGTSEVYDDILEQLGDFGKYQILQYLLLFPPVFFTAAFTLTYVFTAGAVPHR